MPFTEANKRAMEEADMAIVNNAMNDMDNFNNKHFIISEFSDLFFILQQIIDPTEIHAQNL